jgi:hypothetical protein
MNDATAVISGLPANAARMVAVEILLADPEALDDDILESCLYILREKIRARVTTSRARTPEHSPATCPCSL